MIYPDGRSAKWYHNQRTIKILLFSTVLVIAGFLFWFFNKPAVLEDLSGGKYPETFRTVYRPLQKELLLLHAEGFFVSLLQLKLLYLPCFWNGIWLLKRD